MVHKTRNPTWLGMRPPQLAASFIRGRDPHVAKPVIGPAGDQTRWPTRRLGPAASAAPPIDLDQCAFPRIRLALKRHRFSDGICKGGHHDYAERPQWAWRLGQ
jgi:hypothetical protein